MEMDSCNGRRRKQNTRISNIENVPQTINLRYSMRWNMYKRYEKGNVYQIDFGSGYGYIQEVGEISAAKPKIYFCIVYALPFADEKDVKELSGEKYFVSPFLYSPSKKFESPYHRNLRDEYLVRETPRGREFEFIDTWVVKETPRGREFECIQTYIYIKCLGLHPVPSNLEFPQYYRNVDYNFISGTHKLIVQTVPDGNFVKQQKTVKGIEHMPPYMGSSFNLCVFWWKEGLTLETWNDEYCSRVIERRYSECPWERPIKMTFEEAVETMPVKDWRDGETDEKRLEWCDKAEDALQQFVKVLSSAEKISLKDAKKATKELCLKLNELQKEEYYIETVERDDLYTFVTNLLQVKKVVSAADILDEYRKW